LGGLNPQAKKESKRRGTEKCKDLIKRGVRRLARNRGLIKGLGVGSKRDKPGQTNGDPQVPSKKKRNGPKALSIGKRSEGMGAEATSLGISHRIGTGR